MKIVVDLHAYLHCPKHRRPTNFALYIAPASLSVDVHPDEPNFRIELFGRAPSPSSPTRRLNPDRLDHKADQFVAACFARSPQPPTSSTALRHPIAAATLPRQTPARINPADESHLATPRTLPQVPHPRSIIRTTAPTAPTGTRPPTAPFPPRSLARDSKGPLPRPVCRQSGSLPRTASRLCFGPGLDCHINPAGALVPRSKISSTVTAHQAALQTANGTETGLVLCPFFVFFFSFDPAPSITPPPPFRLPLVRIFKRRPSPSFLIRSALRTLGHRTAVDNLRRRRRVWP